MTTVLITPTPDGRQAFDISTKEKRDKVVLDIVQDRMNRGFYIQPALPTAPEMTTTQIRKLPPGKVRDYANSLCSQYKTDLQRYNRLQMEYEAIQACLVSKNGEAAMQVLESRREYEMEEFEIFEVS